MKPKFLNVFATVAILLLAATGSHAQSAFSNAVISLNPAGYWPMHEVEAPAPGDIETNYGTLGLLGTGYYPDWATTPAVALKRQHVGPFTVAGQTDLSVNFTHNNVTGSTEQFTNMMFVPHSSPLTTLNPPFSVECWFYPTNLSTGVDVWSQCGDEGLNAGAEGGTIGFISGIRLVWVNSTLVVYTMNNQYDTGSANSNRMVFVEANLSSNQWYHIVLNCDVATNISLYTNGVQVSGTAVAIGKYAPDYWTPLTVGGGYGATRSIAGDISEFAVYTNALKVTDIDAHYSDGLNIGSSQYFADVMASNPAIYLRMSSPTYAAPAFASLPALSNLGTTNGIAVGNGVYSAGTAPGILSGPANTNGTLLSGLSSTNTALLSGISSFADAGFAPTYNPTGSNANFTVTAMFRGYPGDGRIQSIVGRGTNSWQLSLSTNGCLVFNAGNGNKAAGGTSQSAGDITTTGVYNDGNWHQVVVVNQTNVVSIYVDTGLDTNGTPAGITTTNLIPGNANDVLIGSDPSYTNTPAGVGRSFAGQVCEVAFFNNALNFGQIQMLYSNSGDVVAPSINAQPVTGRALNGGTGSFVYFGVVAKGTPALAYQWYFNTNASYSGATQLTDNVVHYINSETSQVTVTNLTANDSGYYFVIITNQYGSATSILASLTVNVSPTITSQFPVTYTNLFALYAGANPGFSVSASGSTPLFYQWFTNGVLDGAATTNSLQMANVQASFSNYCVVTNISGSVTSFVWSASVLADPGAPYPQSVLALNPIGYWRMNDTNLDGVDGNDVGSIGSGNGDVGDNGYVCHDYIGGNDGLYTNCYLDFPGYNPTADPSDSSAQFGEESDSDFGDSLAFAIQNVNFGSPAGTSVAFTVEAWVSGFPQTSDTGIVTLGYGNGGEQFCLGTSTNTLTAQAGQEAFRFFFRDASGSAHSVLSPVVPSTRSQGPWYHLAGVVDEVHGNVAFYIDGQLVGTTTIASSLGVLQSLYPMGIGSRMSGQNTSFNDQFLGNINDVAIFNYALSSNQVLNEYINSGNIAPFLTQLPPTNETVAAGSPVVIPALAAGTGPLSYYWTDVGSGTNVATGATNGTQLNATLGITSVPPGWNGDQLELTVSNAYGATNVYVGFTVLTAPILATNIPSQFTLAQGRSYTYIPGVIGAQPLYYQWYSGAVSILGQTNSTYTLTASSLGTYTYSVVISNYLGAVTSAVSTVTVVPLPGGAYATSILGLNPVGYWPMHEVEAPAQGDVETNYGTLGLLGTGYYPDWAKNSGGIVRNVPGALADGSDTAANFTHSEITGSTVEFTNGLFVPHTSPLSTLNPPFSVECWFYPTNLSTGVDIWAQCGEEGLNAGPEGGVTGYINGIELVWANATFVVYSFNNQLDQGVLNSDKAAVENTQNASNAWYHVVVTCDANDNVSLYTNGVLANEGGQGGTYSPDYWTPLSIGSGLGNTRSIAGDIDEFAVYPTNLSAADIAYHYAVGTSASPQTNYFTVVTNDNPSIYLRMVSPPYTAPPANTWPTLFNYGSAGISGVYTPGTDPGIVPGPANGSTPFNGLSGTNVAQLSGVSSFADAGSSPTYNPVGTAPFSITAMFRGNPCDGRYQDIVGHSDNSWRVAMNDNGTLQCSFGSDANNVVNSSGIYNDGNWHQMVDIYQPASNPNVTGTNLLYVDGKLDNEITDASTNGVGPGSTSDVMIGSDPEYTNSPAGVGRQFAGQICEVALFTNALTAAQIQSLYQIAVSSGSVNPNPTNIVFSESNNQLTLSWPADHIGWQLQAQTNSLSVGISTNWVNVSGSTTTNQVIIPINLSKGCIFYRLTY